MSEPDVNVTLAGGMAGCAVVCLAGFVAILAFAWLIVLPAVGLLYLTGCLK